MYSINELKTGVYVEIDGTPYQVVDYQHSKQARQGGIMRTTLRNILTGATVEKTFKGSEKVEPAEVSYVKGQFLYKDDNGYNFMDTVSYEQFWLSPDQIGDNGKYLLDGTEVDVQVYKELPVSVRLPISMNFTVVDTPPGVKGDTATGGTKPAVIQTGITVQVPLFINNGDVVKVDTRTATYTERVSKS